LKNLLPGVLHTDTLRWDLPDNWIIEPETYAYSLDDKESQTVSFTVQVTDSLYPLPTVSTYLPYTYNKAVKVSRTLEIARIIIGEYTDKITIDGHLTEDCWQKPFSAFLNQDGGLSERDSIAVYFAYNENNLYMAVYCHESFIDSIFANMTIRDADVYTEDAFGFLYQPNSPDGDVYQFYANPLGTVYDQHIVRQSDGYWLGDPSWKGNYEVKSALGDDHYILEVCFPMDQYRTTIASGDQWRVNFRRKHRRVNMAYALQVPWTYNPRSFGILIFR
jgi:hypothetical protein